MGRRVWLDYDRGLEVEPNQPSLSQTSGFETRDDGYGEGIYWYGLINIQRSLHSNQEASSQEEGCKTSEFLHGLPREYNF